MNIVAIGTTLPLDLIVSSVSGGIPGLAPTVALQRLSDGYYWTGVVFQPGFVKVLLTEIDAINRPGLYSKTFSNQGGDTTAQIYIAYYDTESLTYPGVGLDELVYDNQIAEVDTLAIAQAVASKILVNPGIPINSADIASQITLLEVNDDVDEILATMATQSSLDAYMATIIADLNIIISTIQPQIGSVAVTFTVLDQNTLPVPGVKITVKNSTSAINLAVIYTDTNGQAVAALDPGTYNVFYSKAFYAFGILPQVIVVPNVASYSVSESCTSFQPASVTPGICNVFAYLTDASGNAVVGEMVRAKLTSNFPFSPGLSMLATKSNIEVLSDSNGFVTLPLIVGGTYEINSPALFLTITDFLIPNQASLDLSTLLQFNS